MDVIDEGIGTTTAPPRQVELFVVDGANLYAVSLLVHVKFCGVVMALVPALHRLLHSFGLPVGTARTPSTVPALCEVGGGLFGITQTAGSSRG